MLEATDTMQAQVQAAAAASAPSLLPRPCWPG